MAGSPNIDSDGHGRLGDRPVRRIGFGAMQLQNARTQAERDDAVELLQAVIGSGVDHIDTAQFYGAGSVNELLRMALSPYPENLQLVTKVGAEELPSAGLVAAQRPAQLRVGVEANLTALGVDQLAVVNLRRLDAGPGILAGGDQLVDLDSQLVELIALREEGKIAGIGLSNVDLRQLRQAAPAGIVCVQNAYSVLDRTHEELLAECERSTIAFVPFFPLGSAFARLPNVADDPVVVAQARRQGVTAAQLGLAWLLGHSPAVLLIPGTRDRAHLAENLAAGSVKLDDAARDALDALAAPGDAESQAVLQ